MKKWLLFSLIIIASELYSESYSESNLTKFVNPYIGTGGHGHTFLGVTTPFGAVQIGPNNIYKGWDWSSGYHYSDSIVIGFSHLHLNGTGCSDTGDILFMPYTGKLFSNPRSQNNAMTGYGSYYSHKKEITEPGYYSLWLDDYNTNVELTSSDRVAFHRYTFPNNNIDKYVMINLKDANGDDTPIETFLEQIDDRTIRGYRFSTGWSTLQQIYFTAIFSDPVKLIITDDDNKDEKMSVSKGNVVLSKNTKQISVKVGISPVSMTNARANIAAEINHWDFENVVKQNTDKWNCELSKIIIETKDSVLKKIFYTSMYHAFMQPIVFNDFNGDYRGTDKKVYKESSFTNHTVFSLWDTYRAAHPLYTILQSQRVPDFINSMLAICDQQGRLPVWHLYGSDTNEMIGIQSIPVIADAILKDIKGFDYEKAFDAMKRSMLLSDYKGLTYVRYLGYIPADKERETVAKGLEYAIGDWCIAQVAKKLNKTEDYLLFSKRAKYYQNYWDHSTNFFRGKNSNGSWTLPFDPLKSKHRDDDYCEGTAWQYTWLVPHDVEGLISLFGSEEAFTSKLDSLFEVKYSAGNESSIDISGLIGQYAHGNEPGHHIVYLYPYVGQQWKTAARVREILTTMYFDNPNGLPGNEDCGQMSSWFIFSSLGFYPVNPSNGIYVFGSPLFEKAKIEFPDGKSFTIISENNSAENIYIQSVELNGKEYSKSYITHADLITGGTLKFVMGNYPNIEFGKSFNDRPKSIN